jgi:hypothetical protein
MGMATTTIYTGWTDDVGDAQRTYFEYERAPLKPEAILVRPRLPWESGFRRPPLPAPRSLEPAGLPLLPAGGPGPGVRRLAPRPWTARNFRRIE